MSPLKARLIGLDGLSASRANLLYLQFCVSRLHLWWCFCLLPLRAHYGDVFDRMSDRQLVSKVFCIVTSFILRQSGNKIRECVW